MGGGPYEEQQTLVLADGPAAAEEAQQEQHAPHGQDDVDPGEQQGVRRHNLPEARGVHQHPHPHPQEEGAPQLTEERSEREREGGKNNRSDPLFGTHTGL